MAEEEEDRRRSVIGGGHGGLSTKPVVEILQCTIDHLQWLSWLGGNFPPDTYIPLPERERRGAAGAGFLRRRARGSLGRGPHGTRQHGRTRGGPRRLTPPGNAGAGAWQSWPHGQEAWRALVPAARAALTCETHAGMHLSAVTVIATSRCNQRCSYCCVTGRPPASPRWTAVRVALDALLASPVNRVKVAFTGGEPLLARPLVARTIRYVEAHRRPGQSVRYKVLTNGLLLDGRTLAWLRRRAVELRISLDGARSAQESPKRRDVRRAGQPRPAAAATVTRLLPVPRRRGGDADAGDRTAAVRVGVVPDRVRRCQHQDRRCDGRAGARRRPVSRTGPAVRRDLRGVAHPLSANRHRRRHRVPQRVPVSECAARRSPGCAGRRSAAISWWTSTGTSPRACSPRARTRTGGA